MDRGGKHKTTPHQTFHHPRNESRSLGAFYVDVFEFKQEEKALEDPNFYLTDGTVTMILAPYKIEDYLGTEHKRPGFDHIGFEVENLEAFKNDVEALTQTDPEYLAPKAPTSSPNIKSSWISSGAAGMDNTKCVTQKET